MSELMEFGGSVVAIREMADAIQAAVSEAVASMQALGKAGSQVGKALENAAKQFSTTNKAVSGMSGASTDALKGMANLAGGVGGLLEKMAAVETGAGSMAGVVAGGAQLAITLVAAAAGRISEIKAQQLRDAKDAVAAYVAVSEETDTAKRNLAILEDQTSTMEQVSSAKAALAEQFPDLITGWDAEGNAIISNNEAIKAQIKYMEILTSAKLSAASKSPDSLAEDYNKTVKKMQGYRKYMSEPDEILNMANYSQMYGPWDTFLSLFDRKDYKEIDQDATKWRNDLLNKIPDIKKSIMAEIQSQTGGTDVGNAMSAYIDRQLRINVDNESEMEGDYAQDFISHYNNWLKSGFESAGDDASVETQKFKNKLKESSNEVRTAIAAFSANAIMNKDTSDAKLLPDLLDYLNSNEFGTATKEFETLSAKITNFTATDADVERYNQVLADLTSHAGVTDKVFKNFSNSSLISAEALKQAAIKADAAGKSYLDMGKEVSGAYSSLRSFRGDMSEVGSLEAVKKALDAGPGTKNYANALAFLAQQYGVTEEEAAGMAGQLEKEIQLKKDLTAASIGLARAQAEAQILVVAEMQRNQQMTEDQAANMTAALQNVIGQYDNLVDESGKLKESEIKVKMPGTSGGGAASQVNEELQKELALLSRKKSLDGLTYTEEIAWLNRIRDQHAQTNEERADLDDKLYAARKQKETAELEFERSMDRLTIQSEMDKIEEQKKGYEEGTQYWMDLETKLHQLKISQAQSELESKKAYNQLTLDGEIKMLKDQLTFYGENTEARKKLEQQIYQLKIQMLDSELAYKKAMGDLTLQEEKSALEARIKSYTEGTEAYQEMNMRIFQLDKELAQSQRDHRKAMDDLTLEQEAALIQEQMRLFKNGAEEYNQLEEQLYGVRKAIRERDAQNIDAVADGVMEALRNKYEQQLKAEEDRLDESSKEWEAWGKAQTDAIDVQIKALDKLTKSEDRAEEEAEKLRKIAMLEQEIQYEQDGYNKEQLQKQLDAAREELAKWRTQNERDDAKEKLEEEKKEVAETVTAEQEKLEKQREEIQKAYDELLKEKNIQAEAEKLLLAGNQ